MVRGFRVLEFMAQAKVNGASWLCLGSGCRSQEPAPRERSEHLQGLGLGLRA